MTNMFSGNTEKKIPKNIDDCIKLDNTSKDLWFWCEQMERWGKILFWIIIISGIILSLISAIQINEVTKGIYYTYTDTKTSFSFVLFITSLLDTALYAFIEYCTYHAIALLIGALARIVQNSKITVNIALYNATRNAEQKENDTVSVSENEVSEPQHKTRKSASLKSDQKPPVAPQKISSDKIMCPECGYEQYADRTVRWEYGRTFINGQKGIPYRCGSCGHEGPYDGPCPECGSTMRIFNTST